MRGAWPVAAVVAAHLEGIRKAFLRGSIEFGEGGPDIRHRIAPSVP
jgi:hypothetical protein